MTTNGEPEIDVAGFGCLLSFLMNLWFEET
jgi:hypothetical protein